MIMHSVSAYFRSVALAFLLAVGCSVGAWAQPTVSMRGNVGATFFRSPDILSETLHSGVNVGIGGAVRVYRGLAITAQGGYDQFTLNEETARIFQQSVEVADFSFVNGSLGLRYTYLNDSDAHPYVSTGVGLYRLKQSNRKILEEDGFVDLPSDETFTDLGGHLAIGALFRLDDTYAVFFEPRYVFYDLGQGLGGSLRYFTLRLGVDVQLWGRGD